MLSLSQTVTPPPTRTSTNRLPSKSKLSLTYSPQTHTATRPPVHSSLTHPIASTHPHIPPSYHWPLTYWHTSSFLTHCPCYSYRMLQSTTPATVVMTGVPAAASPTSPNVPGCRCLSIAQLVLGVVAFMLGIMKIFILVGVIYVGIWTGIVVCKRQLVSAINSVEAVSSASFFTNTKFELLVTNLSYAIG